MCLDHDVPMEEGDHSTCSVELLSCLEHRADQMRAMGYDPSAAAGEECLGTVLILVLEACAW
jgi:hypothetical protein